MNTATFRTLIEQMGMPRQWIASELEVNERTVRRWLSPDHDTLPDGVASWVMRQLRAFEDFIDAEYSKPVDADAPQVTILRVPGEAHATSVGGMPASMVNAARGALARELMAGPRPVTIDWQK